MLTGGVARGDYKIGESDVTAVVVLRTASFTQLDAISEATQAARYGARIGAHVPHARRDPGRRRCVPAPLRRGEALEHRHSRHRSLRGRRRARHASPPPDRARAPRSPSVAPPRGDGRDARARSGRRIGRAEGPPSAPPARTGRSSRSAASRAMRTSRASSAAPARATKSTLLRSSRRRRTPPPRTRRSRACSALPFWTWNKEPAPTRCVRKPKLTTHDYPYLALEGVPLVLPGTFEG